MRLRCSSVQTLPVTSCENTPRSRRNFASVRNWPVGALVRFGCELEMYSWFTQTQPESLEPPNWGAEPMTWPDQSEFQPSPKKVT